MTQAPCLISLFLNNVIGHSRAESGDMSNIIIRSDKMNNATLAHDDVHARAPDTIHSRPPHKFPNTNSIRAFHGTYKCRIVCTSAALQVTYCARSQASQIKNNWSIIFSPIKHFNSLKVHLACAILVFVSILLLVHFTWQNTFVTLSVSFWFGSEIVSSTYIFAMLSILTDWTDDVSGWRF